MASLVFRKYKEIFKEMYKKSPRLISVEEALLLLTASDQRIKEEKKCERVIVRRKAMGRRTRTEIDILRFFKKMGAEASIPVIREDVRQTTTCQSLEIQQSSTKEEIIEVGITPPSAIEQLDRTIKTLKVEEESAVADDRRVLVESRPSPIESAMKPFKRLRRAIAPEPKILLNVERYEILDDATAFLGYMRDRYKRLRSILVRKVKAVRDGSDSTYLYVLVDRKIDKNTYGLVIGDYLDENEEFKRCLIFVDFTKNGDNFLREKFEKILSDTVVAFKVRKLSGNKFRAEDIVFPDIPRMRERKRPSRDVRVLFLSDVHVGSKKFLRDVFEQFIRFINGEGLDQKLREIADTIEYIVITGDVVDGVGVYPDQKAELDIANIHEQYAEVAELLSEIPQDIRLIIIPGNHDATTNFLPQLPIPKEFAEPLYEMRNVTMLSNPAIVEIEGIRMLLYHGLGLEKTASELHMGITKPSRIVVELLRYRHLLPVWGSAPIAPVSRDYLVIDDVPDIVAMGHVHIFDARLLKGDVLVIVSGAFQDITSWQIKLGIQPTPGLFSAVNLSTFEIDVIQFTNKGVKLQKVLK